MYVSGTAIGIRLDGLPDHESKCGSGSAAKGLRRVLEAGVGRLCSPGLTCKRRGSMACVRLTRRAETRNALASFSGCRRGGWRSKNKRAAAGEALPSATGRRHAGQHGMAGKGE